MSTFSATFLKKNEKLLEGDSGDISLREKAIIDLWKRLRGGPFGGAIQKALEKYLGNDKTALTQGDFNAHELNKMKDHLILILMSTPSHKIGKLI